MKTILVFLAMVVLVGCAPTGWIAVNKDYCLGKSDQVSVGSVMVGKEVKTYEYHPGLRLNYDPKVAIREDFREELIYGGIVGFAIKIMYREYRNDLARPAFYQEVQYDLSQSKTITFRKTTIEIIEATNSYCRFEVISTPEDINRANVPDWVKIDFYQQRKCE
jgi:hypothetical protein